MGVGGNTGEKTGDENIKKKAWRGRVESALRCGALPRPPYRARLCNLACLNLVYGPTGRSVTIAPPAVQNLERKRPLFGTKVLFGPIECLQISHYRESLYSLIRTAISIYRESCVSPGAEESSHHRAPSGFERANCSPTPSFATFSHPEPLPLRFTPIQR